jgi:ferredoxin
MPDQIVAPSAFTALIDLLIGEQPVFGVTRRAAHRGRDVFAYERLTRAADLRLDYDVTILPPKAFFLPPREDLLRFTTGPKPAVEPLVNHGPFIVVGVHPYDLVAINQLDRVFADQRADEHYLARRANATVIASNIRKAGPRAFANQMGATRVDRGFDLFLTDIGEALVVTVGSEKGAALLSRAAGVRDATPDERRRRDLALAAADALYGQNALDCDARELPELLRPDSTWEHPVWEEKSRSCYSCGTCNTVCPTCVCFDVRDEVEIDLRSGVRRRSWDGCLLLDFARVASGENFRHKRVERFRHRFGRKFLYLHDRYGLIYCVGCGRCVTQCLPDIANPVAVFNALNRGKEQT